MTAARDACGRCGRPLANRAIGGEWVGVCDGCRLVTVDQRAFDRLIGLGPTPSWTVASASPPPQVAAPPAAQAVPPWRRPALLVPMLLAALLLPAGSVVGGAMVYVGLSGATTTATSVQPFVEDESPSLPAARARRMATARAEADARASSPPEEAGTAPTPTQTPTAAPSSTPASAPPVAPSAARDDAEDTAALIVAGWERVERTPSDARALFARVLARDPNHPEASYGFGYSLLRERQPDQARPHLCRALEGADTATRRELEGILARHRLDCAG